MSEAWRPTRLKFVATLVAGGTPSVDDPAYWTQGDDGLPWVAISDMTRQTLIDETSRRVTPQGLQAARLAVGQAGTLLFSMYASLGTTAVLAMPATWNQAIVGIVPKPGNSAAFLRYALEAIKPQLPRLARSNTQDNLNARQVGNLPLLTSDTRRQHEVADFLHRESHRIRQLDERLLRFEARLAEDAEASFERLVSDADAVCLKYALQGIEQGWSPECDAHLADPGSWGVLKVGAVNYGRFRASEHKALPNHLRARAEYRVEPGDLLMSRANTRELVGSAAMVDNVGSWHLMLCDKLYRLKVIPTILRPRYAAFALNSPSTRHQIEIATSGASASMQNISQPLVRSLRIPMPSVADQEAVERQLIRLAQQRDPLIATLALTRQRLDEYRCSLIAEAVTGRLDPSRLSDARMDEVAHAAIQGEHIGALAK